MVKEMIKFYGGRKMANDRKVTLNLNAVLIGVLVITAFLCFLFFPSPSTNYVVNKIIRIENGKVEVLYRLKIIESIPIKSIEFKKSIYEKAIEEGDIVDLNIALKVGNELIKPYNNLSLCLWARSPVNYSIEGGNLILTVDTVVSKKPTKVELLIFSGKTLIGRKILQAKENIAG